MEKRIEPLKVIAHPILLKLLKKKYGKDIPAPACCPVTKKGNYFGERRRWLPEVA
jgi:hypothetical protein